MKNEKPVTVAPLVGAWIEIPIVNALCIINESLLSWERGLKYRPLITTLFRFLVAPLVGAWIEIALTSMLSSLL